MKTGLFANKSTSGMVWKILLANRPRSTKCSIRFDRARRRPLDRRDEQKPRGDGEGREISRRLIFSLKRRAGRDAAIAGTKGRYPASRALVHSPVFKGER